MANQLVSTSVLPSSWRYDVFLSFRGEDTRFTFTDHLYQALVRNGINTFIDRHLVRGEEISPAFLKAIEDSRISVIVFSENYASSRWCLDELVHIRECRQSRQQIVWPVFYKVDPSHVRNQTSSFGDAFTGLECKYKDEEKILLWRSALKEVANLSGHTIKEGEYEATFINKIVKEILVEVLQRSYLRNKNIDRWQAILDSYDSYEGEPYRGIQRTLRKSYDAWDYVVQQVNLVTFDMPYSGIKQLKGFKNLAKLTSMNLSGCEFLKKIPDLSGSPNLRDLNLSNCKSLVEVDDSIGFLDKLKDLSLRGCSKLMKFATRLGLRSLQVLSLCECTRLETFPEIEEGKMESLWYLDIEKSGIRKLPSSFAYLTGLGTLKGNGCENLANTSLRHYINVDFLECSKLVTESQLLSTDSDDNCITLAFPKLHYLGFRGCNLSESDFLVPFNCWSTLAELDLSRNNFVSLPDCISKFVNLETLSLSGCKRFREIPQVLPPKLVELYLDDCTSLEKIPPLPPMLRILDLCNCFGLSGDEVQKLENNLLNSNQVPLSSYFLLKFRIYFVDT
ncbi:disease resistance protein RPV1-like [Pyrus x bretschneideri]|uniref:disease resistance protein RPV1-like n=1 Tax=Pyrus x bretschneideri TaxID=225117 RepID=UPI0020301B31|nr:disease resistance protein RPV1-like [Pyrus x bretschneideri]